MRFMSRYNPAGGIADFWEYIRRPIPYRWPILGLSCLVTSTLFFWFVTEHTFVPPEPPKVTYISTFAEGRSDAEIRRTNLENQKRKEERQAERNEVTQKKRDIYKALGEVSGMDVASIEKQVEAERAREAAEEKANQDKLYTAGDTVER